MSAREELHGTVQPGKLGRKPAQRGTRAPALPPRALLGSPTQARPPTGQRTTSTPTTIDHPTTARPTVPPCYRPRVDRPRATPPHRPREIVRRRRVQYGEGRQALKQACGPATAAAAPIATALATTTPAAATTTAPGTTTPAPIAPALGTTATATAIATAPTAAAPAPRRAEPGEHQAQRRVHRPGRGRLTSRPPFGVPPQRLRRARGPGGTVPPRYGLRVRRVEQRQRTVPVDLPDTPTGSVVQREPELTETHAHEVARGPGPRPPVRAGAVERVHHLLHLSRLRDLVRLGMAGQGGGVVVVAVRHDDPHDAGRPARHSTAPASSWKTSGQ
ncbi:hypothetical protein ACGF5F_10245 [Streptomyces sp. NPDC047821]|uniref:hypothetical protein n=1 Tax=Streptomyces sp. NPDC047821 TaxID=3365488 RepID=UPI003716D5C1